MTHSHLKPSVGVLLLDSQLRLVHYTAEAASILGYPRKPREAFSMDVVPPATRSQLTDLSKASLPSSTEITSGRRRYLCRIFLLDSNGRPGSRVQPSIVVVLERVATQALDLTRLSEEYQLTIRERETVKFLLKGLTSKEIADEMSISPNTVKSFLKLVMAKVGASNRTGIIAKILEKAS